MENLAGSPRTPPAPLRVLIADSDGDTRRTYVDALRWLGCDAIEATDGRDALVEALVRRPSLIVMASRLPLVNGPALCEILRRDLQTRSVPIVAIAPDTTAPDAERVRRAGATVVLVKPVTVGTLVSEVRRLTGSSTDDGAAPPVVATPPDPIAPAVDPTVRKRLAHSKMHVRCTTTSPPIAPPLLRCPTCDGPLLYERSYLGGVNQRQPEQWDDYECPACGTFEYRHRTRRLREIEAR
jgi:CheY-like chemotaxis protein